MAKKPTYEELEQRVKELEKETFDRKQAEGLVRKREQKLEELLSVSLVVIYRCEPKDNFPATFITENVRNQLGYEPHEFTERSDFWSSHIHPDDAPRILSNLTNLFERGYHTHEYRFLHKDGTYRWMYDESRLIYDVDGKPTDIVGNWMDITDRKQAEEALRESEEKYRLLTEQNLLGVIIIQDGFVKYVNKAASELTEYSIKEALNWEINEFGRLFHPDDLEFVMEQAQKKQEGAKNVVTRYSYRIITKSGKVKWVDQYSKTIIFEGKTADLITIIDITERKRAEDGLRESKEKYRQLSDSLPQIVFETDEKGNLTFTNRMAFDILGYTRERAECTSDVNT